jgi:glucokinase
MTVPVIGLDIGGSKLAAALMDPAGKIVAREQAVSPAAEGPEAMIAAVGALVNCLVATTGQSPKHPPPLAVGVATAGVVDPDEGVIRSAVDTIKGWAGVPLRRRLEELTGLPVAVENDVNAMGLAETSRGAAYGARSALVVAVGTGIGGALMLDGQLWRGRTGSAGEIGHIPVDVGGGENALPCSCGRAGHLEAIAAGPAIAARYAALAGDGRARRLEEVGRACSDGDEAAIGVVNHAGSVLGRALGGLCNVVDPEVVVLAGGVIALGRPFVDPLILALRAEALPGPANLAVRVSKLGPDAGVVGAGIAALRGVPYKRQPAPDLDTGGPVGRLQVSGAETTGSGS